MITITLTEHQYETLRHQLNVREQHLYDAMVRARREADHDEHQLAGEEREYLLDLFDVLPDIH